MSCTAIIHAAAGAPVLEGARSGICRTCGELGTGQLFRDWVRDTFMDHDKLTAGEIVCHACQFCFTDRNEALTRITGKEKPQRMRNYSHFVVAGEWIPLSKGNKVYMLECLRRQPQVAVIADSGQKHILFRARRGWWQFEEQALRPFPRELERLLALVGPLYQGGFSKTEIATGRYLQHRILQFGVLDWSAIEALVRPSRGRAELELALYLAQREEIEEEEGANDGATNGGSYESGTLF